MRSSEIVAGRRLTWAGIAVAAAGAVTVAWARFTDSPDSPLAAGAFLFAFAIPPALALVSLDRRPALLPVAAMAALFQAVMVFTTPAAWGLVVAMVLWVLAHRRRPGARLAPDALRRWRPLLAVAALVPILVLFVHLDPVCVEGGGVELDATADQGWVFPPRLVRSGVGTGERECTSDTVRAWEAAVSMLASVGVVALASRWPTNDRLVEAGRT